MRSPPRVVAGVRLGAPLAVLPGSAVCRGWAVDTGRPVLLRVADPGAPAPWADAPFPPGLLAPTRGHTADGRAWLRLDAPGAALATLWPLDGPAGPLWTARALVRGLQLLQAGSPALPVDALLFVDEERLVAGWLGPGHTAPGPGALAPLAQSLDPGDPLGAEVAGWAQAPPPSLEDAELLVVRALATALVGARHGLEHRRKQGDRRDGWTRLQAAVVGLQQVLPPPPADAALPRRGDSAPLRVHSDGHQVRLGGSGPGLLVWHPDRGLDPIACRLVLRTWALAGDQAPQAGAPLLRWLRGMSTLRRAALLLGRQRRRGV